VLELSQLLPFLAASLALNLTPGADMTYVIARSATQGRAAGLAGSLGIAAGSAVHTVLAAVGVSALLQHSETAFLIVKYAGAAYLLYLAWKAIRSGDTAPSTERHLGRAGLWRVFASAAAQTIGKSAGFARWLNRISALVFVGLAVRLALTERR
jgi:threonine/homoserine/homoserine lactone efflux protein